MQNSIQAFVFFHPENQGSSMKITLDNELKGAVQSVIDIGRYYFLKIFREWAKSHFL